jgi:hypothetical protein
MQRGEDGGLLQKLAKILDNEQREALFASA